MDNLIQEFSLLGICSLAVAINVLCALIRRALELFLPFLAKAEISAKKQKVVEYSNRWARAYNELGLYLLPYLVGSTIAVFKISFVFGALDSYGGRWIFSMLVATFSALFYKSIKKALPGLLGVQVETSDKVLHLPAKE